MHFTVSFMLKFHCTPNIIKSKSAKLVQKRYYELVTKNSFSNNTPSLLQLLHKANYYNFLKFFFLSFMLSIMDKVAIVYFSHFYDVCKKYLKMTSASSSHLEKTLLLYYSYNSMDNVVDWISLAKVHSKLVFFFNFDRKLGEEVETFFNL